MRALAIALGLILLSGGCVHAPPQPPHESPPPVQALDTRFVTIEGRPFELMVMLSNASLQDGTHDPFVGLAIAGDGGHISFMTDGRPYRAVIAGATIKYGGHSFTITPSPGTYESDGKRISLVLGAHKVHCFVNGEYMGDEDL